MVAMSSAILDQQKVSEEANPDCSIARIGVEPINTMAGGWMGKADYNDRCTSVLYDALRSHFLELRSSDVLHQLMMQRLSDADTRTGAACSDEVELETSQFGVKQLLGPLVVHAAVLAIVLLILLVRRLRRVRGTEASPEAAEASPWEAAEAAVRATPKVEGTGKALSATEPTTAELLREQGRLRAKVEKLEVTLLTFLDMSRELLSPSGVASPMASGRIRVRRRRATESAKGAVQAIPHEVPSTKSV